MRVIGLMSGTSQDGVDAALLDVTENDTSHPQMRLEAFVSTPYGPDQRALIRDAIDGGGAAELCTLHTELGEWFAAGTRRLLAEARVRADRIAVIGSHGHTVWHRPPADGRRGATLQLGDPATLASRTEIPVVSDFRAADMAAGGQGAPLVPWADRLFFSKPHRARALQNLGGVGNVTWLPELGDEASSLAFDTGPANALLDAAARLASDGSLEQDLDGTMAAQGHVDHDLLDRLMAHPFLDTPPPKSTGRELFGPSEVEELSRARGLEPGSDHQGWNDLLATLTAFTAASIGEAYRRWIEPRGVDEVVLTGGGAKNPQLVRLITAALDPLPVLTGAEALGMDPDAREAAAFGALAWAHLRGVPGNVPMATGASRACVLGTLTPAPGRPAGRP